MANENEILLPASKSTVASDAIVIPFSPLEAANEFREFMKKEGARTILKAYAQEEEIQFFLWIAFIAKWLESFNSNRKADVDEYDQSTRYPAELPRKKS